MFCMDKADKPFYCPFPTARDSFPQIDFVVITFSAREPHFREDHTFGSLFDLAAETPRFLF